MSAQGEPEIVLYDLAYTKNVCFSPVVWRIRLQLNYKKVPYKTIFLELPDIEPTLKGLGLEPQPAPGSRIKYTVPTIHHVPTNKYIMDSVPISQFIESTYPDPPVPLTSELGREIETKAHAVFDLVLRNSLLPREINIFTPRAQEYFRRTREAELGHPIEDLLDADKEQRAWNTANETVGPVVELLRTHEAGGPFVLGARPSYTDFVITGFLQFSRVVDEGVFQRILTFPRFKDIYEACLPYMEKKD